MVKPTDITFVRYNDSQLWLDEAVQLNGFLNTDYDQRVRALIAEKLDEENNPFTVYTVYSIRHLEEVVAHFVFEVETGPVDESDTAPILLLDIQTKDNSLLDIDVWNAVYQHLNYQLAESVQPQDFIKLDQGLANPYRLKQGWLTEIKELSLPFCLFALQSKFAGHEGASLPDLSKYTGNIVVADADSFNNIFSEYVYSKARCHNLSIVNCFSDINKLSGLEKFTIENNLDMDPAIQIKLPDGMYVGGDMTVSARCELPKNSIVKGNVYLRSYSNSMQLTNPKIPDSFCCLGRIEQVRR